MSLRADVESLRDMSANALVAAHNHFVYTKKLWQILHAEIRRGSRTIALNNKVTGSNVTERDVLPIAQAAVNEYLPAATIQQFASVTETFLTDLVRLWLAAHPAHLRGTVEVQLIVAAADKAAIIRMLIDQHVMAMGYKRPRDWFKQLNSIVSLNCPTDPEKARRDVFVHNRGIATEIYRDKAGALARTNVGLPLDLPDTYLHESWRLCRKIVSDLGDAAALKA